MAQLAQLNVARMLYPESDERMAGFFNRLDEINALAEAAPGFVWRFVSDGNNATSLRPFPDDQIIVNMSVWQDVDALYAYTYRSGHASVFKYRKQWFEMPDEAHHVMWWVEDGVRPTVEQAKERLLHLREHGPTPFAFTFKQRFELSEQ